MVSENSYIPSMLGLLTVTQTVKSPIDWCHN